MEHMQFETDLALGPMPALDWDATLFPGDYDPCDISTNSPHPEDKMNVSARHRYQLMCQRPVPTHPLTHAGLVPIAQMTEAYVASHFPKLPALPKAVMLCVQASRCVTLI